MKSVVALLILGLSAGQSIATSCVTCKNSECLTKPKALECNKNLPQLPFNADYKVDVKSTTNDYACLDLTYTEGITNNVLKQCVLVEPGKSICDELKKSVIVSDCKQLAALQGASNDNSSSDNPPDDDPSDDDPSDGSSSTDSDGTSSTDPDGNSSTDSDGSSTTAKPNSASSHVPAFALVMALYLLAK